MKESILIRMSTTVNISNLYPRVSDSATQTHRQRLYHHQPLARARPAPNALLHNSGSPGIGRPSMISKAFWRRVSLSKSG